MDQIRLLAPSMRPPMLPVVSNTNVTSTRGAGAFAATAGAAARVKARLPASIDITHLLESFTRREEWLFPDRRSSASVVQSEVTRHGAPPDPFTIPEARCIDMVVRSGWGSGW